MSVSKYLASIEADPTGRDVAQYMRLLEDCLPETNEDLQSCVKIFMRFNKKASCQVIYERYIRANPSSWDIKLDYVQLKTGLGSEVTRDFYQLIDDSKKLNLAQQIRLADLLKNAGLFIDSIGIVSSLCQLHPESLDAQRVLISCLSATDKTRQAKNLLRKYVQGMDDTLPNWCFVVDEASKLDLESLFNDWASSLEARLPPNEGWCRFVLITAYGRFIHKADQKARNRPKIARLTSEIEISELESEWMLGVLFQINEKLGSTEQMVRLAKKLLVLNQSNFDLINRCESVVKLHTGSLGFLTK